MPKRVWRKGMIVESTGGIVKKPLKIGSIEHIKDIWGKPLTQYRMLVKRDGKWIYAVTVDKAWLDAWAEPIPKNKK